VNAEAFEWDAEYKERLNIEMLTQIAETEWVGFRNLQGEYVFFQIELGGCQHLSQKSAEFACVLLCLKHNEGVTSILTHTTRGNGFRFRQINYIEI